MGSTCLEWMLFSDIVRGGNSSLRNYVYVLLKQCPFLAKRNKFELSIIEIPFLYSQLWNWKRACIFHHIQTIVNQMEIYKCNCPSLTMVRVSSTTNFEKNKKCYRPLRKKL